MISAAVDAARGERLRGASTITQQVMKNFLLSGDRQLERKIKEIILASRIEETLSKEKILELYLNEIFLGQNSYGVAAASQTYFNKTLGELAPHEAAFLASLPKAPSDYHPVRRKDRLLSRRNYVLKEMHDNGYLTTEVYESERAQPLRSVQNGDFESFKDELPPRDYFTDEIRRQLSENFGEGEFFSGGLTVRATIDQEMQPIAANSLRQELENYDRSRSTWRGTGKKIDPEIATGDDWETALNGVTVARDIDLNGQWYPAVVREVGDQRIVLGIEGQGIGEVPRADIKWLKGRGAGRFCGDGREHRPRDRDAGRVQLPELGLQPRDTGETPAGFVVQTLRLCGGTGQWLYAGDHHRRRSD